MIAAEGLVVEASSGIGLDLGGEMSAQHAGEIQMLL
jgi:hypothetical protein